MRMCTQVHFSIKIQSERYSLGVKFNNKKIIGNRYLKQILIRNGVNSYEVIVNRWEARWPHG